MLMVFKTEFFISFLSLARMYRLRATIEAAATMAEEFIFAANMGNYSKLENVVRFYNTMN